MTEQDALIQPEGTSNFIREIVDEHNRTGRFGGQASDAICEYLSITE